MKETRTLTSSCIKRENCCVKLKNNEKLSHIVKNIFTKGVGVEEIVTEMHDKNEMFCGEKKVRAFLLNYSTVMFLLETFLSYSLKSSKEIVPDLSESIL